MELFVPSNCEAKVKLSQNEQGVELMASEESGCIPLAVIFISLSVTKSPQFQVNFSTHPAVLFFSLASQRGKVWLIITYLLPLVF